MARDNETIRDIVAEMRAFKNHPNSKKSVSGSFLTGLLCGLANRLDAAWKREQSKPEENYGNAAAMREALVQCELFLGNLSRHGHPTLCLGDQCTACNGVDELRGMVVRALSAPARNCDVGTAEEQGERCMAQFDQWRRKGDGKKLMTAIMEWAQMPFEEGGAK